MNGFQSSFKGVFGGRGANEILRPHLTPGSWPIFKLAPSPRPERTTKEKLARAVERDIVPRLVAANRPSESLPAPIAQKTARVAAFDPGLVEAFTRTVLSRTTERMDAYIKTQLNDGMCEGDIYFRLIAPCARLLIDLWGDDKLSYTEVTISLNRLHQIIRNFSSETPYNGDCERSPPSALFAPSPKGQQTFGFYVMEELFRWSGWRTWVEVDFDSDDLVAKARCQWFDMVCLNITREADIGTASATISSLRRISRNRDLKVLAYGRVCIEHPLLVDTIGADAAASNANEAFSIMGQALTNSSNQSTRPTID